MGRVPAARANLSSAYPEVGLAVSAVAARHAEFHDVTLNVSNYARSKAFYDQALAPLGMASDMVDGRHPPKSTAAHVVELQNRRGDASQRALRRLHGVGGDDEL